MVPIYFDLVIYNFKTKLHPTYLFHVKSHFIHHPQKIIPLGSIKSFANVDFQSHFFFVVYFCFFLADLFFIFLKLSLLLYLVFLVNFLFVGLSNASSTFCFSFLHENPRKQSSIRAKKIWNLLRSLIFLYSFF